MSVGHVTRTKLKRSAVVSVQWQCTVTVYSTLATLVSGPAWHRVSAAYCHNWTPRNLRLKSREIYSVLYRSPVRNLVFQYHKLFCDTGTFS